MTSKKPSCLFRCIQAKRRRNRIDDVSCNIVIGLQVRLSSVSDRDVGKLPTRTLNKRLEEVSPDCSLSPIVGGLKISFPLASRDLVVK